jgi:hypothetical protein
VAAGHRDGVVVVRGGRWGGVPVRQRRREELGEGWDAPGVLGGFYRGRGCRRGVARVTVVLMALTPLKTGARLRGGLRGGDGGAVMARAASRGAEQAARWNSVVTQPGSAGAGAKRENVLPQRRHRSTG